MTVLDLSPDGSTLRAFMRDESFVRGVRGPVGSGKSVTCCVEVFRRAMMQAKSPRDGLRKTRWAIIRNTQPELRTTTIKTWLSWFTESEFGRFNWAPPFTHRIRRGDIDCEVIFLALDTADDIKKLLSLELTGAFVNEAREIPKAIIDGLTGRVGRYPSEAEGGCTWRGIIMDTNPPEDDHWWAIMSGEQPAPDYLTEEERLLLLKPHNWKFFTQPGAMRPVRDEQGKLLNYEMNPARENRKYIKDDYYLQQLPGKTAGYINVYLCNQYGTSLEGKPVYPMFSRDIHVSREAISPVPGHRIIAGFDFGLSPAMVMIQHVNGRVLVLREVVGRDMGIMRFIEAFRPILAEYSSFRFDFFGDPAGDQRTQTDEETPFRILRAAGIPARAAETNDVALRIEAVTAPLTRLVDRRPGMVIDPGCINLIKGFDGGYHYKRLNVSGPERYQESAEKNRFSHVHDALQYAALGAGEGRALVRMRDQQKVTVATRNWDVFNRKSKAQEKVRLKNW